MPWEAPTTAVPAGALPPVVPPGAAQPADGDPAAAPAGVLSAATVGWVAPPPEPLATGKPGWVIAGVGARIGAYWLDSIVLALAYVIVLFVLVGVTGADMSEGSPTGFAFSGPMTIAVYVVATGLYFLYFVGFWTSGAKATPGMRLFKLQIANAADGKRLDIGPAVIRWVALGGLVSLLFVIPEVGAVASLLGTVWVIALLITTANDGMHQGLHDRWAKSVIVRPESATTSSGAWFATCLIVILIVGIIFLIPIIALLLLGGQLSEILSSVGESI